MPFPDWRAWLFSIKAFVAMSLALFIALSIDLPRPYWAMGTAYIVAQPLSGMVQSKAAYRVAGTIGGAVFAVFALPTLVDAPELLVLALALWTGLCLYASLLDKTPRAYAFMLAGYTAAFIVFPGVAVPDAIFDTALSRAEEIILAIMCVTLVDLLIFPQRVGPILQRRLDSWFDDVAAWTAQTLSKSAARDQKETDAEWRKLVVDAMAIEQLRVHAAFDTRAMRRSQPWLLELQRRMQTLFALLTSIDDRILTLRGQRAEFLHPIEPLLETIGRWMQAPDGVPAANIKQLLSEREPAPWQVRDDMDALLVSNLLVRLGDLVDVWEECWDLRSKVVRGVPSRASALPLAVHRDHGMAIRSGAAAALAVGATSTFWIVSGWPDGSSAPMMAAVLCSFFATQDDPGPMILAFLKTIVIAAFIGGLYLFVIFPAIDGYPLLILSLAPFLIPVAAFIAVPATSLYGLGLIVNSATSMGLQEIYSADLQTYANSSTALVIGSVAAFGITRLVRSVGSGVAVKRLVRSIQRDLARLATGELSIGRAQLEGRMFDRIGALIPRLGSAATARPEAILRGALADLRLGHNLLNLRQIRGRLAPDSDRLLRAFLQALPPFLRHRRPDDPQADAELLDRLDGLLGAIAREPIGPFSTEALLSLIGVRRALFPASGSHQIGGSNADPAPSPVDRLIEASPA